MQNAFGNVIFAHDEGRYWRNCPEDWVCDVIAADSEAFDSVRVSESFVIDRGMQALVDQTRAAIRTPTAQRCYCFKIPNVLGGAYALDNVGTIDRVELIAASGHIAEQIRELPDGRKSRLKITDYLIRYNLCATSPRLNNIDSVVLSWGFLQRMWV